MSFQVLIDFDNDKTFAYDITGYVMGVLSCAHGIEPYNRIADESTAALELDNRDKRFSPENTLSPYYPNLRGGLGIKILYDSVSLWVGYTDVWEATPHRYGDLRARLSCKGFKWLLESIEAELPLYENKRTDEIIVNVLNIGGAFPPANSLWVLGRAGLTELGITTALAGASSFGDISTGDTVVRRAAHNYRNEDGTYNLYEVLNDIVSVEPSRLWFNKDGRAVFTSRNEWLLSETVNYTVDNDASEPPEYATVEDVIKNRVVIKGATVEEGGVADIVWQLDAPVTFNNNQTVVFRVLPRDPNTRELIGAKDIVTPSGADFVWTSGGGTVTVDQSAELVTLTVTATAGGVLDTLILRAKPLRSTAFEVVASDLDSIAKYRTRQLTKTIRVLDNPITASEIANLELRRYANDTPTVRSVVHQRGFSELSDVSPFITLDVGAVIRVKDAQVGHDRNYRLMQIERDINADDRTMTVTWHLEPSEYGIFWLLGVVGNTELGTGTVLAF